MAGLPALKTRTPTDFELFSILCEVEAILNCRPITKLTCDIDDWRALTPLSVLTGNLHPDSPIAECSKGDLYRQNYRYVVAVSEQFWSRWLQMYVPWLQIRHRWHECQPNVKVGDLVLLLESRSECTMHMSSNLTNAQNCQQFISICTHAVVPPPDTQICYISRITQI